MTSIFPEIGTTNWWGEEERNRTGPYKPSLSDRIYTLRIRTLGSSETMTPNIRIRLARAGIVMSLGHDGDWEIVRLRSAWATQTNFEEMSDQNGVAIEIIAKRTCTGEEFAQTQNWEGIDTGIPGIVAISTGSGSRPHVRWMAKAGREEPDFTIAINRREPAPEPDAQRLVWSWVNRNYDDLLRFWWFGEAWNAEEHLDFVTGLRPVIAICTWCEQHPAVLQIGRHAALCRTCKARVRDYPHGLGHG